MKEGVEKVCEVCGKTYISFSHNQKYCSVQCRSSAAAEKNRLRKRAKYTSTNCQVCGKPLNMDDYRSMKYCSKECCRKAENQKKRKRRASATDEHCCTRIESCYYGIKSGPLPMCNYAFITGQIRGGNPGECKYYKRRKRGRNNADN